jgi:hypothetical protein
MLSLPSFGGGGGGGGGGGSLERDIIAIKNIIAQPQPVTEHEYSYTTSNFTLNVVKALDEKAIFIMPETNITYILKPVMIRLYGTLINIVLSEDQTRSIYNNASKRMEEIMGDKVLRTYDDYPMYKGNPVYALFVLSTVIMFHSQRTTIDNPEEDPLHIIVDVIFNTVRDNLYNDKYVFDEKVYTMFVENYLDDPDREDDDREDDDRENIGKEINQKVILDEIFDELDAQTSNWSRAFVTRILNTFNIENPTTPQELASFKKRMQEALLVKEEAQAFYDSIREKISNIQESSLTWTSENIQRILNVYDTRETPETIQSDSDAARFLMRALYGIPGIDTYDRIDDPPPNIHEVVLDEALIPASNLLDIIGDEASMYPPQGRDTNGSEGDDDDEEEELLYEFPPEYPATVNRDGSEMEMVDDASVLGKRRRDY